MFVATGVCATEANGSSVNMSLGPRGFSALFGEVTVMYPAKYVYRLYGFQKWNGCKNTIQPNRFDVDEISPQTLALPAETSTLKGTILTSPQGWVAFPIFKGLSEHRPLGWETKIRFELVTGFMHISSAGLAGNTAYLVEM